MPFENHQCQTNRETRRMYFILIFVSLRSEVVKDLQKALSRTAHTNNQMESSIVMIWFFFSAIRGTILSIIIESKFFSSTSSVISM